MRLSNISKIRYNAVKSIREPELIIPFLRQNVARRVVFPIKYLGFKNKKSVYDSGSFQGQIRERIDEKFSESHTDATIDENSFEQLYSLVKEENPDKIVETGVCNGTSTAALLKAIEENGSGDLYSIDKPVYSPIEEMDPSKSEIPEDEEPGWPIPEKLRESWDLIIGDTYVELPKLLEQLEHIDIFIHDSEHTFKTMFFEYSLAWEYLDQGGWLVSDDIDFNDAFLAFSEKVECERYRCGKLGLLKKL